MQGISPVNVEILLDELNILLRPKAIDKVWRKNQDIQNYVLKIKFKYLSLFTLVVFKVYNPPFFSLKFFEFYY